MPIKSNNLIVFTIDQNYLPHLTVALQSFIHHHDPEQVSIGLIYRNIEDSKIQTLVDFLASRRLKNFIYKVDDFLGDVVVGYHFNQVIFYRFLAPELFSNFDKILYLDSDILFLDNIFEIFDIDLGSSALGAIETTFRGVPLHLKSYINRYLASALLLIDTRKFIDRSIKEKCISFLKAYSYEMPDQDALSFAVQDFVAIDPSYSNFAKNPKIIQFSGSSKPWHMNNRHLYKKNYWHYRSQTPYKSLFPDDFSLLNTIRYTTPNFVKNITPNFVKSFVKKIIGSKSV